MLENKRIDLHGHSIYSDGTDDVISYLTECEKENIFAISITDHNSVEFYDQLEKIDYKKYYSGLILLGVEIHCSFEGTVIELLGHGLEINKIKSFLNEYYSTEAKLSQNAILLDFFYSVCDKNGIKYDKTTPEHIKETGISAGFFRDCVLKYPENEQKISKEIWDDYLKFTRIGMSDPNSIFKFDLYKFFPSVIETSSAIKEAGGKVSLAHPFIYGIGKNTNNEIQEVLSFVNRLRNETNIDGIECFYPKFTNEQHLAILNYTKENNLLILGGSDYHGTNREIKLGTGINNNLFVPKSLLNQFLPEHFYIDKKNIKIIPFDEKYIGQPGKLINDINELEIGTPSKLREDVEDIFNFYDKKGGKFLIAINEIEELVGMIAFKPLSEDKVLLKRFYIKKEYRGSGLSYKLFDEIVTSVYNNNYIKAYFGCKDDRGAAINFYENKLGLTKITKEYFPDDPGDDSEFYEVDIKNYCKRRELLRKQR